ncbi:MAG: ABC transporter substrate-binding protein [SAR324 cluster bacterium]|nr:ABC transporter substrate-binding protein [SAR324 cluster bacterium]
MLRALQSLLFCAILLGGLGWAHHPAHAQPKRLTLALGTVPQTLDPRRASSPTELDLAELIYESLVAPNRQNQWVPQLAERWDRIGETEYWVTLKAGIWFHDGTAFTAAQVKSAFDELQGSPGFPRFRQLADSFAACEVVDERTVRFLLHEPLPESGFLHALHFPIFKHRSLSNQKSGRPIGSGPFILVRRSASELVLRRHWYYHGTAPDVKDLHFQLLPDAKTRIRGLLSEDTALAGNVVSFRELPKLRTPAAQRKFRLVEEAGATYRHLVFNTEHAALQDVRVRQALALAVQREELLALLTKNHARLATGVFPAEHAFHAASKEFSYAPEDAKKRLDEAGYRRTNGKRLQLRLATRNQKEDNRLATLLADQLGRVGIQVTVTRFGRQSFQRVLAGGDYDLVLRQTRVPGNPEALNGLFHSSQTPERGGRNYARYRNPQLDALLASARRESNHAQRKAIYQQAQQILSEELPHLPLWHGNHLALVSRQVEGYRFHPAGVFHALRTLRVN